MASKRFKSSMSGYDKKEVDAYLKNVFDDFEKKIVDKDEEINKLLGQVKKLSKKYEDIKLKEDQIDAEKEKITKALVRADETYAQIIDDAKKESKKEIEDLEKQAEVKREMIVDIKKELLDLKEKANIMINKYKESIESINNEFDIKLEDESSDKVDEAKEEVAEETFEYVEYQIKDDIEEDGE